MDKPDFQYRFLFADGDTHEFNLRLDARTLQAIPPPSRTPPAWTRLEFKQCPNCPLQTSDHPYCPVAVWLDQSLVVCNRLASHDRVRVTVKSPDRFVSTETTAQRALSSLLGLILAASGCPHTRYFKPMARFHLPFANEEETICRATSMYLLAQYFRRQQGSEADFDLDGLVAIYKNMQILNQAMAKRLQTATETDTAINAVILLDLLAKALPYSISDSLQEIRYMFSAYLDKEPEERKK